MQAPRDTALTRLLGIRYPIVRGGMQRVGPADLVSAGSNAGRLRRLTGITQNGPEAFSVEIASFRSMTRQPLASI